MKPAASATAPKGTTTTRDIRLDLFRGLALWFIFLDHVPHNIIGWATVRNWGFSDATEIFVFISGYTAVIAYSRMMEREGWPKASAKIWRRVWQLYVAHILLFVAFTAQIAWVSTARGTPALIEEMQLLGLGENPYRAILEAALLKFRPVNLDVLPLYIVLLAFFPLVLPLVMRWPFAVIVGSLVLWQLTSRLEWNLPGYPEGKYWFFNPLGWQVIFHTGAALAVLAPRLVWLDRWRAWITGAAILFLLFAFTIALSWHFNSLERLIPDWLARQVYPIDKTNLDILRFIHFLALAWMVRVLVRPNAAFLEWPVFRPLRTCGEHSLLVFCLGTFLALSGQIIAASFEESLVSHISVSLAGILLMSLAAYWATWFKAKPVRAELA
jgi:hypothetical protein